MTTPPTEAQAPTLRTAIWNAAKRLGLADVIAIALVDGAVKELAARALSPSPDTRMGEVLIDAAQKLFAKFDSVGASKAGVYHEWHALFVALLNAQNERKNATTRLAASSREGDKPSTLAEVEEAITGLNAIHTRLLAEIAEAQQRSFPTTVWSEAQAWKDAGTILVATVELERARAALASPAPMPETEVEQAAWSECARLYPAALPALAWLKAALGNVSPITDEHIDWAKSVITRRAGSVQESGGKA